MKTVYFAFLGNNEKDFVCSTNKAKLKKMIKSTFKTNKNVKIVKCETTVEQYLFAVHSVYKDSLSYKDL